MKSRRKKQLARLQKKQEITLQQAWDRVCEELNQRRNLIYFVEEDDYRQAGNWELTTGGHNSITIVKQSGGKN